MGHKMAMMKVLIDANDICNDAHKDLQKKRRLKTQKKIKAQDKSLIARKTSKDDLKTPSIDQMLSERRDQIMNALNKDLTKIPENESPSSPTSLYEASISVSNPQSSVHE